MSETKTINEILPTEILIRILKHLHRPATGNAALTCKLWREIADDSCLWCVSISYQVQPDPSKLEFLQTTNRKFHTIKLLGDLKKLQMEDFELIKRLGASVVKIIWMGNHLADITKFGQVLHCLPDLECISLVDCVVDKYNGDLPDFSNLRSLEFSNCEGKIVEIFQRAKLKMLTLQLYSRIPDAMREFLWSQQDMHTTLIVNQEKVVGVRRPSLRDLSALPFKLSKFSITADNRVNESEDILAILRANAETLVDLDLSGRLYNFVYDFLFANLKKLKSLKMCVVMVPKDIKFYEKLDISHLNSLTLIEPPVHCEYFFMRLPHLTNLTLLSCRNKFLKSISDKLNNLTSLSLDSGNQLSTDRIMIPSMTTLHIRTLSHKIDWDEFTKDNHQLTELIIDNVESKEFLNILDIEIITENTSLRVLSIGKCFTASEDMLMVIRRNCPLLEVLILGSDNFSWFVGCRQF